MRIKHQWPLMQEAGTEGATAGDQGAAPEAQSQEEVQKVTQDWRQSIDQGLHEYIEKKGFQSPDDAIKALQEAEGKHAVPETADEYELPVPEGQDGEFAKAAAGWMHEAGIPVEAAKALAGKWNEYQEAAQKQYEQQRAQQDEADVAALKKEWGKQYDANIELGRRAFRTFAGDQEMVEKISQALGSAETLRLFHRIGKNLGEGSLTPDEPSSEKPSAAPDPLGDMAKRMYPNM